MALIEPLIVASTCASYPSRAINMTFDDSAVKVMNQHLADAVMNPINVGEENPINVGEENPINVGDENGKFGNCFIFFGGFRTLRLMDLGFPCESHKFLQISIKLNGISM
mgnify:CR=1 FL=1